VSTDPTQLDVDAIHRYLEGSYWAAGIPRAVVDRSLRNSLNFGVYRGEELVGFARVVTDLATFAYVGDVFVIEAYRGRGLSKWLMECILDHPDLRDVRRWHLVTRDAHGLYAKFGFAEPPPGKHMERVRRTRISPPSAGREPPEGK
jgi:GNAT superfamily N-acetyltransferase